MIDGLPKAIKYLCDNFRFKSLLDIGCGEGLYHNLFPKDVIITGVDLFDRIKSKDLENVEYINMNIFDYQTKNKYDCVFSSHVIEHIANTELFLKLFFKFIKEDGIFCIFYPPPKHEVVGGHVHR